MGIALKEYNMRVDKLRLHFVENWCLCKYCELYDSGNPYFEYWAEALLYAMSDIKSLNVNDGHKLEIINQMLIVEYDFDDSNTIYRIVVDRFNQEGISGSAKICNVCRAFASSATVFVNALGDDSIIAYKYIRDTFSLQ